MAARKRDAPDGGDAPNNSVTSGRAPKRSRKAVNCEPCRASKLKCDRKRPCSGCEIRGTTDLCYPEETGSGGVREDVALSHVDIRTEIARMQSSLRVLDAALPRQGGFSFGTHSGSHREDKGSSASQDASGGTPAERHLHSQGAKPRTGGLYVGPSAPPIALLISRNEETGVVEGLDPQHPMEFLDRSEHRSLLEEYYGLPNRDVLVERLLHFFFDSCTYLCYVIEPAAWFAEWHRECADMAKTNVVTLATAYMMLAIAMNYLPDGDSLIAFLPQGVTSMELGRRWYIASINCISRYRSSGAPPSIEYIELLLLHAQFLSISETNSADLWSVKSDIGAVATALALHRDPGQWNLALSQVERRRWAWWNYIALERWQAFVFGRPITVQPSHFDTRFPIEGPLSPNHTVYDFPNLMYLANFRLVVILGNILVDALSPQSAPYEHVKTHDKALEMWRDTLPPDLRIDDALSVARGLTISTPAKVRCITLQGIYLRMKMHHIRFVLHQQYASATVCPVLSPQTCPEYTKSDNARSGITECLEATVHSASRVIDFLREMIPMCSSNLFLALPGHVSWSANPLFSAALFFAVLLIARPEMPSKELFRQQVQKAMKCLGQLEPYAPQSGNGRVVLQALVPLFEDDLDDAARADQIEALTSLTFPSQDGPLFSLRRRFFIRPVNVPLLSARTRGGRVKRRVDYTTSDGQLPGEIILHPTSPTTTKTAQKTHDALEYDDGDDDDDDDGDSMYAGSDTDDEEAKMASQGVRTPQTRPEPQIPGLASSGPSATTTPISAAASQELPYISPALNARRQSSILSSTLGSPELPLRRSRESGLQDGGVNTALRSGYTIPTSADDFQTSMPRGETFIQPPPTTPPMIPGGHRGSAIPPQPTAEAHRSSQGYQPLTERFSDHTQHSAPQFQISPMRRAANSEYGDQTRVYGPPQSSLPSANFAYRHETFYPGSPLVGFDQSMPPPIIPPHSYTHPHASYPNRPQYGPPGPPQQQQPPITGPSYQNQPPQVAMPGYTVPTAQIHVGYRDASRTSGYPPRQDGQDYDEHVGQHPSHQSPPPNQLPAQAPTPWRGPHEFWA